jgi:hypothetical protein
MKPFILLLLNISPVVLFAQFGVSFHQTNLPFAGISYEISDRIRPEIRLGTDTYMEAMSLEAVVVGDILNKDDYELYLGIGAIGGGEFEGFEIPVGLNIYPLPFKNFGFHIELTPILGDDAILRGSWGIRYKFKRSISNENEQRQKGT